jgi:hypothetical protein
VATVKILDYLTEQINRDAAVVQHVQPKAKRMRADREVKAKKSILIYHRPSFGALDEEPWCSTCQTDHYGDPIAPWPCLTVKAVLSVYATETELLEMMP